MSQVIGEMLPLALGVAISPVPVIAVIMMLLSRHAKPASVGFLAGWLLGISTAVTAFALVATSIDPPAWTAWIKLGLGLCLLYLAYKQWRAEDRPSWLDNIDSLTAGRAAGLGYLLAAINPKNLTLCAAAGMTIGGGHLKGGQTAICIVIFTVLAGLSVALPVLARQWLPLERIRAWLTANSNTVMAVLLLVLGIVLVGKGISGIG